MNLPIFLPTILASGVLSLLLFPAALAAQTPAENKIAEALKIVEARPDDPSALASLAFAYASRARETADEQFHVQGMATVQKALALDADHYQACKAEALILLGQNEFQKALVKTRELNKRSGDDPMVYAMRTDAAMALGNYQEAEEAAQWALDVDSGGVPGLTRAAHLRELFGDFDGAIELMQRSFNRIRSSETGDRARIMTQIGNLYLLKGDAESAQKAHRAALALFPNHPASLRNLARTKSALGDYGEALALHHRHYVTAPRPGNLYELAVAMRNAGQDEEADKAFADFEKAALEQSRTFDNANRELTEYYLDEAGKPAEALRISRLEMANRRDWQTCYAHARALHAAGEFREAHEMMTQALAPGIIIPRMQYHAGIIARDARHLKAAQGFFETAARRAVNEELRKRATLAGQGE